MVEFATLEEVKGFFNLQEDDEIDDLLQFLIEHYSDVINDKTETTAITTKTKEALYYAIGCHLSKLKLEKIFPTIAYTVGNVKERLMAPATADQSWCSLFKDKIDEIKGEGTAEYAARAGRRKGLADLREFQ